METFYDWILGILIIFGTIFILGYTSWKSDKLDGGNRVRSLLLVITLWLIASLIMCYVQTLIY